MFYEALEVVVKFNNNNNKREIYLRRKLRSEAKLNAPSELDKLCNPFVVSLFRSYH